MTIYHPDIQLMTDFAAGNLPFAQSTCVSVHMTYCDSCQRHAQHLQSVGSALFDSLSPVELDTSLLSSVMAQLEDPQPLTYSIPGEANNDASRSPLMQCLMEGSYENLEWQRVTKSLQISRITTGDPHNELSLYHIKAGGTVPEHTHRGTELTLVLEGSFSDQDGVYHQGDFLIRDGEDIHTPTASQSADCICLAVLDAPIRFTRWKHRWMNPFMRLQAN